MRKDTKIYLILVVIVILIIAGIFYIKNLNKPASANEATMKCIASKAVMYSQTTCSHCIAQKQILGNYTSLFNIIECDKDLKECSDAQITGTPTWIINNQTRVEGVQSIQKLKQLTNC